MSDRERMVILAASINALDESDAWWNAGAALSTKQWVKRVVAAYRDKKLLQITNDEIELQS